MSRDLDIITITGDELDKLRDAMADRDRLASDLQAKTAELEETRHDLAKFQRSERVLAEVLREKMAELERVRRNHLRRMGTSAVLRSWQQVDPGRSDALTLFAGKCFRAALATMDPKT